ncbi:OB-fold nucleic acid binding domain-containing protein [Actinomyces sp. F1_1611]
MGLLDRWRKPEALREVHDRIPDEPSCSAVGQCQERHKARIHGIVQQVETSADPQQFRAELSDGTGTIHLVWVGRDQVPGIVVGAHLVAEGTVGRNQGGGLRILDPQFSIRAE